MTSNLRIGPLLLAFLTIAAPAQATVIGRSVEGRPIISTRIGPPDAPVRLLVVGSIHGNEKAGHAVIDRLRRIEPPDGVALWLVREANPDGVARRTRQNARGVDLNRNFPRRWRGGGRPFDPYHPGRRAASEPETRAMMRLIREVRPQATVWYHQWLRLVNLSPGADPAVVRGFARRVGLPARTLPPYRGTATSWQNHTFPGTSAFVVELGAGRVDPERHLRAVMALAEARAEASASRPRIVWRGIPFGADRRRQMRAYARRHYGLDSARLSGPKAIVQHFTASSTFSSAWSTFASNAPDPEYRERPGVCAHFLIDRDGTIAQLVPLRLMCRHAIGLNHVAIGIEHVGRSDAEVTRNRAQTAASLRLTRWLMHRHGIACADVIGHAESRSSPHYRERVRPNAPVHSDFSPATMRRYRERACRATAGSRP